MKSFEEEIFYDVEAKKNATENIMHAMMNSQRVLSLEELAKGYPDTAKKLSQDEFVAAYYLALEIVRINRSGNARSNSLYQYLEVSAQDVNSVNKHKLLTFVNQSVEDMRITRQRNPNSKWNLEPNKILSRIHRQGHEETVRICG